MTTGGPMILVAGAGPTGLGAAWRMRELGHERFRIAERERFVGGLARSERDSVGFTWDVGGHVLFSHYDYFDRLFERVMRGEYTLNQRESWVRVRGRWVPYPFQNNIRYLAPEDACECLLGLVRAQAGRRGTPGAEARNFGEFIDAVFGEGIAQLFMRPYNFKVWAHPPEMLGKEWIGERVAVIDLERAIRNVVLGLDDYGWGPNNRFRFPLGGTGEFYLRLAREVSDRLDLGVGVVRVDSSRREATLGDGTSARYDALLTTIPLDVLCTRVIADAPAHVRAAAAALTHSGAHMVGIGIRRPCPSTRCWMYFPGDDCPFYRVTYLSNYSPRMTPDPATHYSLLCETSTSEHRPVNGKRIVEQTIEGLRSVGLLEPGEERDIVSRWHCFAPYAYPTPTVERDDLLATVLAWLESSGIHSRGRFGLWKYEVANTDHCLMQGVELVNRLLLGEPETTIGIRYQTTADGRSRALHDRPEVAGSGEKRGPRQDEAKVVVRPGPGAPAGREGAAAGG